MITAKCERAPRTGCFESVVAGDASGEPTSRGHRVGLAPLPYVVLERGRETGLFVERGGWGGRPAYVRCDGDVVLASTDLAWVVKESRARGKRLTLDAECVASECVFDAGHEGKTRTFFSEIQEIPPGSRTWLSPGVVASERLSVPAPRDTADVDAVAHLRRLLGAALDRALARVGCVGVLTGGGLDSSALLAFAVARGLRATAFALSFGGEQGDEGDDRPYLDALSLALGIRPVRHAIADSEHLHAFAAAGLPLTWPSGASEALLMSAAKAWGAERVLVGLGADELFDGDPEAASLLVRPHGLRRAVGAARRYDSASLLDGLRRTFWPWVRRGVPWPLRRIARHRVHADALPWAGPTLRRVLVAAQERARAARPWVERTAAERVSAGFFAPHFARTSALRLQLETLAGVPRVDPYLDGDLATFAMSLPPAELFAGIGRRGLFREAIEGLLPESIRQRHDKASFAPVHRALFRAPLVKKIAASVNVARLADLGIVEPLAFQRAFVSATRAAHDGGVVDARVYAALAVEAFLGTCG